MSASLRETVVLVGLDSDGAVDVVARHVALNHLLLA
jgi:hypothetical protein